MANSTKQNIAQTKKFGAFGAFLKEMREKRNITQSQLAKKLGYTTSQFISNWERGLCNPPLDTIPEITLFLGIPKKEVMSVILKQTKFDLEKVFSDSKSSKRNS